MEQYLIDTSSVSDYLSRSLSHTALEFLDSVIDNIPNISIISQIELLCWKTDITTERNVKNFIEDSKVIDIDSEIISYCVDLRKNKKIKTPDAIIAATALAHNFVLITSNEKDFSNIENLKIVNQHKL